MADLIRKICIYPLKSLLNLREKNSTFNWNLEFELWNLNLEI
ncbi:hypothetical protein NU08_0841 [Flavobacterium anhuiense]|uniref:Uncharacterized protein n=1 Tax=Flavobacterium anhuiense TaxID=459526 RepID=A0A444W2F3_9FLAO|nr:hypothetical protein NU08_0841 [Flavobacterium anhuiense]